jgi:hypothetical protein
MWTGSMAGQLAKQLYKCKVIGSCGGPQKCEVVKTKFGFDNVIDYRTTPDKESLKAALKVWGACMCVCVTFVSAHSPYGLRRRLPRGSTCTSRTSAATSSRRPSRACAPKVRARLSLMFACFLVVCVFHSGVAGMLMRLRMVWCAGRIAVCGGISEYSKDKTANVSFNPLAMVYTSQRIEGALLSSVSCVILVCLSVCLCLSACDLFS